MEIFKNYRQEQSYLFMDSYLHLGTPMRRISKQVFISLSNDSCDNAPMCDLYGEVDDDRFFVYSVTITGTRINITSLFSAKQLEEIGDQMSKRPEVYEEI